MTLQERARDFTAKTVGEMLELLEKAADRIDALESQLAEWVKQNAPGGWIDDLRHENRLLKKDKEDFCMDYRIKCDRETKQLEAENARLKSAMNPDWDVKSACMESVRQMQKIAGDLNADNKRLRDELEEAKKAGWIEGYKHGAWSAQPTQAIGKFIDGKLTK